MVLLFCSLLSFHFHFQDKGYICVASTGGFFSLSLFLDQHALEKNKRKKGELKTQFA